MLRGIGMCNRFQVEMGVQVVVVVVVVLVVVETQGAKRKTKARKLCHDRGWPLASVLWLSLVLDHARRVILTLAVEGDSIQALVASIGEKAQL